MNYETYNRRVNLAKRLFNDGKISEHSCAKMVLELTIQYVNAVLQEINGK